MTASRREQVAAITRFLAWLPDTVSITNDDESLAELVARFADEILTECDSAIGHGPGHQSISPCIVTGVHTEHTSDMGHEWHDKDIGDQTVVLPRYPRAGRVQKTYRLAFDPY